MWVETKDLVCLCSSEVEKVKISQQEGSRAEDAREKVGCKRRREGGDGTAGERRGEARGREISFS